MSKEFRILEAKTHTVLEKLVNEHLNDKWSLYSHFMIIPCNKNGLMPQTKVGTPNMYNHIYYQAMVK